MDLGQLVSKTNVLINNHVTIALLMVQSLLLREL